MKKHRTNSVQPDRTFAHPGNPQPVLSGYYQRPFLLFHSELAKAGYRSETPHPIRRRFWGLLEERLYGYQEGRELLLLYLRSVQDELRSVISRHSLAYWLHVYRRLAPGAIGSDKRPAIAGLTRATYEAAVQRYAPFAACSGVGLSDVVPIAQVLNGLLLAPEFKPERDMLEHQRLLVLTDFGPWQLQECYDVERLAYEAYRTGALLRGVGKGALLKVDSSEERVDNRCSGELRTLLTSFDVRCDRKSVGPLTASKEGVVYSAFSGEATGLALLPTYNTGGLTSDDYEDFFANVLNFHFALPFAPNFVWVLYNLRAFRTSHAPFADAFQMRHKVALDDVLAVVAALASRMLWLWTGPANETEKFGRVMHSWQRAYEGPYTRQFVTETVHTFLPAAARILALNSEEAGRLRPTDGMRFWELEPDRGDDRHMGVDVAYPGPHSIFLPLGEDRLFIDYAWIIRRLHDLFADVPLPGQNFKGSLLETAVRFRTSALPVGPCRSGNGKRQIDAAFAVGTRLVIAECRAKGWSIAFDRGIADAVEQRKRFIASALDDVDEKARWLARHPTGENYSLRGYQEVLPTVVTPFVEFIPTLAPRYWLTETLPRVLTPTELRDALEDGTMQGTVGNVVTIPS